jgi:surfactin family lipopeptide synthetase C
MVGPFINTLPVRARIDEGEAVLDWLRGLQSRLVEMRRYEYSPLVAVQGWSEVPRGRPLFESFLNFLNYPMPANREGEQGGLKLLDFRNTERSNYPLILDAALAAELSLEITADAGRFSPASVERMLEDLSEILRALAADERATLGSLGGRLDEAERRRKAERERGAREQRQRRLRETRRKAATDDE